MWEKKAPLEQPEHAAQVATSEEASPEVEPEFEEASESPPPPNKEVERVF